MPVAALVMMWLLDGCMPEPTPGTRRQGGTGGGGNGGAGAAGRGSAGSGGSGGQTAGSGGSAGAPGGSGGIGGASTGSGGSGGSGGGGGSAGGGGSGDSGGSGGSDARPADATAEVPSGATFSQVRDVISNCVFCHPGEVDVVVNTEFADSSNLYKLLTAEQPTPYVPPACQFKRLVVPGQPMQSLLYLKLQTPPPPNCGMRMPLPVENNPARPAPAADIEVIRSWIASGAPDN